MAAGALPEDRTPCRPRQKRPGLRPGSSSLRGPVVPVRGLELRFHGLDLGEAVAKLLLLGLELLQGRYLVGHPGDAILVGTDLVTGVRHPGQLVLVQELPGSLA